MGFDSASNLAFVYNALNVDGALVTGGCEGYKYSIPMVGIRMLEYGGGDCSRQDELGSFMYITPNVDAITGFPASGKDVYGFLNHTWRDRTPARAPSSAGATGEIYDAGYGGIGREVRYVYDGTEANKFWSECNMANTRGDRKFVVAGKPLDFRFGQKIKLSFALVAVVPRPFLYCQMYERLGELRTTSDSAFMRFCNPVKPESLTAWDAGAIKIYPNPTNSIVFIEGMTGEVELYNAMGQRVWVPVDQGKEVMRVDMSGLATGMYFLRVGGDCRFICRSVLKE
jgi:hypothetical protein